MFEVEPKVYLIAGTMLDTEGECRYLESINQREWRSNATSDSDELIEFAGRLCYRSWSSYDEKNPLGTNKNVSRVREDNEKYIQNIINHAHGSTLEHSNITMLFDNVSRVLTHELVRHRAGMAYSQESLRYVRLDKLKFWIPDEVKVNPELLSVFIETVQYLENVQEKLNKIINLDGLSFDEKKKWTSRFRRLAPIGLGTSILVTGNLRAWRHIVNMRGNEHAEEEIRMVVNQVAPILKQFSPSTFSDLINNNGVWEYQNNPKP